MHEMFSSSLQVADTEQVRLVEHLHFTAWPDHGVPIYPGPLLHFHKCYRSGLTGPEPVVVHCRLDYYFFEYFSNHNRFGIPIILI